MSGPHQTRTIGVIGPAGFGGSYLCVELLRRGHAVIGLSRNPESFGSCPGYTPRGLDIESASIEDMARDFSDIDVLVSQYGAHTQGAGALQYMPYIEVVRKMILAVKLANIKYFVFVGGAGSLLVPTTHDSLADHPSFFLSYRRQMAESDAHVQYMEERLGPIGEGLRVYRNAHLAVKSGKATTTDLQTIDAYENNVRKNDRASDYIKAGRASLLFFEGNTSFPWTFVSPSPLYRPGPRTGSYEITIDYVPLKGVQKDENNVLEGRLTGISAADLAAAIVDEIESPKLLHKHWTATADLSNDTAYPCYVTAKNIHEHI
ncbi:hypothetical protein N7466_003314 [Penicillium verhagenii]|uniref:uncharacterized protein n=1 Tax=Penicillium verhagenii TaxID=1562060 RepID=UPI0025451C56|nr:uncharacterized protein N7466_003314 [Penicillium verhagenii]KAJ5936864.1 hypothetical protein N7466_003314 [Penicillium verhagenii]